MLRARALLPLFAAAVLVACGIDSETTASFESAGGTSTGGSGPGGADIGGSGASAAGTSAGGKGGGSAGKGGSAAKGGTGGTGGTAGNGADGGAAGTGVGANGGSAGEGLSGSGGSAGTGAGGKGGAAGNGAAGTAGSGGAGLGGKAGSAGVGGLSAGGGGTAGGAGEAGSGGEGGRGGAGQAGNGGGGEAGSGGAAAGAAGGAGAAGSSAGAAGRGGAAAGSGGSGTEPCGNGELDPGEECDGSEGTTGGFDCTEKCLVACDDPGFSHRDLATGVCYFTIVDSDGEAITWDEAESGCKDLGGRLATFPDPVVRDRVRIDLASSADGLWVGAVQTPPSTPKCDDRFVGWAWITGEAIPAPSSKVWQSSQPNDSDDCESNGQDCARTGDKNDFRLNDAPCEEPRVGLCVRVPTP